MQKECLQLPWKQLCCDADLKLGNLALRTAQVTEKEYNYFKKIDIIHQRMCLCARARKTKLGHGHALKFDALEALDKVALAHGVGSRDQHGVVGGVKKLPNVAQKAHGGCQSTMVDFLCCVRHTRQCRCLKQVPSQCASRWRA